MAPTQLFGGRVLESLESAPEPLVASLLSAPLVELEVDVASDASLVCEEPVAVVALDEPLLESVDGALEFDVAVLLDVEPLVAEVDVDVAAVACDVVVPCVVVAPVVPDVLGAPDDESGFTPGLLAAVEHAAGQSNKLAKKTERIGVPREEVMKATALPSKQIRSWFAVRVWKRFRLTKAP